MLIGRLDQLGLRWLLDGKIDRLRALEDLVDLAGSAPAPIRTVGVPDAVKTRLWIALTAYLLVAIVRNQLKLSASLHTVLTILEVKLFEKVPVIELLTKTVHFDTVHGITSQ